MDKKQGEPPGEHTLPDGSFDSRLTADASLVGNRALPLLFGDYRLQHPQFFLDGTVHFVNPADCKIGVNVGHAPRQFLPALIRIRIVHDDFDRRIFPQVVHPFQYFIV